MSDPDVKAPNRVAGEVDVSPSEHEVYETVELAQELIRALDAESNKHMEQISVDDKGSGPENSSP
jgi:hypothetical protein